MGYNSPTYKWGIPWGYNPLVLTFVRKLPGTSKDSPFSLGSLLESSNFPRSIFNSWMFCFGSHQALKSMAKKSGFVGLALEFSTNMVIFDLWLTLPKLTYCWWKKSQTTTWNVWTLVNNGISTTNLNWCTPKSSTFEAFLKGNYIFQPQMLR